MVCWVGQIRSGQRRDNSGPLEKREQEVRNQNNKRREKEIGFKKSVSEIRITLFFSVFYFLNFIYNNMFFSELVPKAC